MAQEHRIIRRGITSRPLVYRIPAGTGAPPSMIKRLVSLQRHQTFDHQFDLVANRSPGASGARMADVTAGDLLPSRDERA
jgi:hypothetical protein